MAVILNTKPRLRLPPGDLPQPKLARSRSWIPCFIVLWICTVIVGHGILYHWLPLTTESESPAANSVAVIRSENESTSIAPVSSARTRPQLLPLSVPQAPSLRQPEPLQPRALDLDKLPACEVINVDDNDDRSINGRLLPVDLSRTPLGTLLDFRRWTGPCRAHRAARVHLCLVLRNGSILAATARADPPDTSLERCVIRAAARVPLEPEDALRKVQLDVEVAAEHLR